VRAVRGIAGAFAAAHLKSLYTRAPCDKTLVATAVADFVAEKAPPYHKAFKAAPASSSSGAAGMPSSTDDQGPSGPP